MKCPNCKKVAKSRFDFYWEPAFRKFFCLHCSALLRGEWKMVLLDFAGLLLGISAASGILFFLSTIFGDPPGYIVLILFFLIFTPFALLTGILQEKFTVFKILKSPDKVEKEWGWLPKGLSVGKAKKVPFEFRVNSNTIQNQ